MATDLVEVNPNNPSGEVLERAAATIREGKIVAVPTDALYALVADPLNLLAVTKVYAAKGREPNRALPMLVSDLLMAEELAGEISQRFYYLARRYWPGPLTLIVPASAKVPLKVTGNTGRLAMRQSKSNLLNALLDVFERPLVCTSANISGQPTCRSGIEVDAGAGEAIMKRGRSLLAAGIVSTRGEFRRGETVFVTGGGKVIARGIANYSSAEIKKIAGEKSSRIEEILGYIEAPEVINRDNLVIEE